MKLIVILLSITLVALVAAFVISYIRLGNNEDVADNSFTNSQEVQSDAIEDHQDEETVTDDTEYNDYIMRDGTVEGIGNIDSEVNESTGLDILNSDAIQEVTKNLSIDIPTDDFVYEGYDTEYNHYMYSIKDSDIIIAVSINSSNVYVEGIYNKLATEFGTIYFINGTPENYEEIYLMVPSDELYITDYVSGDTFIYWAATDPSNKIEVNLNEPEC